MLKANNPPPDAPRTSPVFVSGSLSIQQLPDRVKQRLQIIVERELPVLIGDAHGADAAIQRCIFDYGARDVTVFCGGTKPRHNIGGWPVKRVRADAPTWTRAFHSAKDKEMASLAGAGFVIWDGTSQGSRANIRRLCERRRYVVVYLHAQGRFITLATDTERTDFLKSRLAS
ncbi:hypothetical protein [Sphingobium aquiterrae]|uniref:hypothetical protein n=1 Tax=Sphingobium TaxID=165695 RepID=UPI00301665F8